MQSAETDPRVSCPIVCGQYMRATGFFFSTSEETYLVTARHNVLPTEGQNLRAGEISPSFETKEFLPTIDVYLRTKQGFEVESLDIREVEGVKQSPEIDVLGVPLDLDPGEYGYQVWEAEDISRPPEETNSLDVIGFAGSTFPAKQREYDPEMYSKSISEPVTLPLVNDLLDANKLSRCGLIGVATDDEFVGDDTDYNGLSGSPILGNGLVGIHSQNWKLPSEAVDRIEGGKIMQIIYSRAGVLPRMLE